MGACSGMSQCFLVIINSVFALFGLLFLVVGCIVRFGSEILDTYLQNFYSELQKLMEKAGSGTNLSNFNLGDYLQSATLAFIIIGAFFFVIGILGCFGACCKVKTCLVVYAVIIGIILLAEVIFVILLFTIRDKLESVLEDPLYDSLRNDFIGINSSDAISMGWNFAMITFKCCGVKNYTDFYNASKWQRNYRLPDSNETIHLQIPFACCKSNNSFANFNANSNLACVKNPSLENANIHEGCYDSLLDFLTDNSDILIGVGASIAGIEVLMVIFAICVCKAASKNRVDKAEW